MLRLLTDENFNNKIVRGLRLRLPQLDVVSVKHMGLAGSPDLLLLKWAAQNKRAMLTHDIRTMVPYAKELLKRGEPMAGVIVIPQQLQIGRVIKDLEKLIEDSSESNLRDRIEYLPLRRVKY